MEFLGDITTHGELQWFQYQLVEKALLPWAGKQVKVTVELHTKSRSQGQNRWYWGIAIAQCIIPFIKQSQGETVTKDEVHAFHLAELMKVKFHTKSIMGRSVMIFEDVSTKNMSTVEFIQFKELVQKYWAEKGLDIPDPIEQSYINQYGK